jgi:hypothetical protein
MLSLLREMILFLRQEKKWWLIPFFLLLGIIGFFIIFAQSSALAPFLYPLF